MTSDEDLRRDRLESHLSELMRTATGDAGAFAQLEPMEAGIEGRIDVVSLGSHESPCASVSDSLPLDEAEATVLHEAGHWLEGHENLGSEVWRQYLVAREYDALNGTRSRGRFEQAANRRGLELVRDERVLSVLDAPPQRVEELLVRDARQYGDFDL
jgi:hypothetical protein